jgi:hypothetical protein
LRRASSDSTPPSSSNEGDSDRPVLRRATPDASAAAPAQAPAAPTQPAAQPQPQAAQAAPAAPPQPPPAPPTIKVGQTQDAVVAALGQPDSVDASGAKQVYVYKSVKVTFTNGKVSKVE